MDVLGYRGGGGGCLGVTLRAADLTGPNQIGVGSRVLTAEIPPNTFRRAARGLAALQRTAAAVRSEEEEGQLLGCQINTGHRPEAGTFNGPPASSWLSHMTGTRKVGG